MKRGDSMDAMTTKELAEKMRELALELAENLSQYIETYDGKRGKKAAAKRSRRLSIELEKLAKRFRKETVAEEKEQ